MYRHLENFLNFFRVMATENLKKNMILALKFFNIAFWLYIARGGKKNWFQRRFHELNNGYQFGCFAHRTWILELGSWGM